MTQPLEKCQKITLQERIFIKLSLTKKNPLLFLSHIWTVEDTKTEKGDFLNYYYLLFVAHVY